jgi:hypothetical protein
MGSREELKVVIDQLPEARLEPVRMMLEHQVHPRPPRPELDRIRRRGEEYQRLVEQRFRETGRPGTVSGFGGAGFGDVYDGVPIGSHGFHYWDGDALVNQTLQSFSGRQIEIMQRPVNFFRPHEVEVHRRTFERQPYSTARRRIPLFRGAGHFHGPLTTNQALSKGFPCLAARGEKRFRWQRNIVAGRG